MLVTVTQECIDRAIRALRHPKARKCICCPVAQALNKRYHVSSFHVHKKGVPMREATELARLPESAVIFIAEFDRNKPVEPFKFELEL